MVQEFQANYSQIQSQHPEQQDTDPALDDQYNYQQEQYDQQEYSNQYDKP